MQGGGFGCRPFFCLAVWDWALQKGTCSIRSEHAFCLCLAVAVLGGCEDRCHSF
jgi:hypothetical protein